MISAILLYNQKGEVLISRYYREGIRRATADLFRIQVISSPDVRSPVLTLGTTTFCHVKHENIYLVAISRQNADIALVFEFLYKIVALGRAYFTRLDEEAVKDNFALIYELLDEVMDFGYPQNTEGDTLKMYITTESVKSESKPVESSKITMQATGAMSWRRDDIKYRRNEVFVDVFEDVNLLMSATGRTLRTDVTGRIMLRVFLSGMPECKFGLNDRLLIDGNDESESSRKTASRAAAGSVSLEDCQFHQCVKLGRFDQDRTINFIPPDGEFELMKYRATENINLPFKVAVMVREIGKSRVEYKIDVKAMFGVKLFATNVLVRIPTPLNTATVTTHVTQGKAKYEPSENVINWRIPRFPGGMEYVFTGEAELLSSMTTHKTWSRPPISMQFSLMMFTSSGLLVRYLKVFEKSNYTSIKWVRYIVRAGSYEIRF
ncbi:Mu homology domain-containing protein [Limtongia smithiae]|uniref:Mu homology domain-containing protein n=1 Tax=Limtongia smithiae TaxID=1125753 RepID=UPI0034CD3E56